jgi:pimeloyl-ACP methyl ester carboxylesterase
MPDARGHGRSSRIGGRFTVDRLAADAAGLLDALGVRGALVLGHSMGAVTAAALAADRPDLVRAVILEDPPLDPPPVDDLVRRHGFLDDLASWQAVPDDERHRIAAERQPAWHRLETDPWADAKLRVDPDLAGHLDAFRRFPWREALDRLTVPGLLLTGDPRLGALVSELVAEEAMRRWAAGRHVRIAGAGHCVRRDRWAAAIREIRAVLVRHAGR